MFFKQFILSGLFVVAYVKASGQQRCRTPSGSIGYCVPFQSCEPFYKMGEKDWFTPDDILEIEKSWCGILYGVRTICCPKSIQLTPMTHQSVPSALIDKHGGTDDFSMHPNVNLEVLQKCGRSSSDRIVNGNKTAPFEFPWMVMLRMVHVHNRLIVFCSGTLISERYVLTAAHCLRGVQGEINIHSVVLGEHDTSTNPDCIRDDCADEIQEIPIDKTIPHPDFSLATAKNDIGLIRLRHNVKFSDSVAPICLPHTTESLNLDLTKVIVMGWGGTEHGPSSNVLLKAVLNVTPNSECSKIYRRVYRNRLIIDDQFMCAFDGQSDTCSGDSGGPAVFSASTQYGPRYFQYGIVSAGTRLCGEIDGVPGLYTRVTSYLQWILDNIGE